MIVSRSEARGPTVSVYSRIVERLLLAGCTILGVKHGVAAFAIQFLESYYYYILLLVAVDHSHLVGRVLNLVVRDGTGPRIWRLRNSGSSFRRKKKIYTWYGLFLSDRWSLIGRGSYIK